MTYDITIKNIDLNLLREQKEVLNELQYKTAISGISVPEFKALSGIINLIDHIQDQAVEQHGLQDEEVYKFSEE